ncbi:MAG: hypothetical protein ABGX04_05400 [Myxococcales bacterium]|nr:hypothetical protein [Myxococcales bacterium]HIK84356.1 hypothetical protein [Myxococcales bacterium]
MRIRETPFESAPQIQETTLYLGRRSMPPRDGQGPAEFDVHFFQHLAHDRIAMAITCGDLAGDVPILARVHSSCLTSECLLGQDCDCADQLQAALGMMRGEGAGVLFYLMQEGRGAGLTAKARDRMIVQASKNRKTTFEAYAEMGLPADLRRYEILAPMGRMLGLRAPLRLLTNNPDKASAVVKVLAAEDIRVDRTERIHGSTSPFNSDYLIAKHDSGHAFFPESEVAGTLPPLSVRVLPPIALRGDRHRVLTASYFLPIAFSMTRPARNSEAREGNCDSASASGQAIVEWVRLSVIFDGESARESVLLSHRETDIDEIAAEASLEEGEIESITLSMLDRLPGMASSARLALGEAIARMSAVGHGSVAVHFEDRARFISSPTVGRPDSGHRVAR